MQTVQIDRKTWIQIPDDADPVERKARWLARIAEAREKSPARSPMAGRARREAVVYDEWVEDAELTAASRAEETEAERKRKAEAKEKADAEAKARAERRKEEDRERGRKQREKAKAEREKAKAEREKAEKAKGIAAIKPEYKPKQRIDHKAWYAWMKANEPEKYRAYLDKMKRYMERVLADPVRAEAYRERQRDYDRTKRKRRKPGKELTEEQKRMQYSRHQRWLSKMKETDPDRYAEYLDERRRYSRLYRQRKRAERAAQATEQ